LENDNGFSPVFDLKIEVHRDELYQALEPALERGLTAIGMTGERYAKENIVANGSVVTGRLLNSISFAVDGEDVYIGTNVEYAPYVELGTSRSRAKPYLKPAAQDHGREYSDLLKASLEAG
jgi:phage gpG-like protein